MQKAEQDTKRYHQDPFDVRREGCLHDWQDFFPHQAKGSATPCELDPPEEYQQGKHDWHVLQAMSIHGDINQNHQHRYGSPIVQVLYVGQITLPPMLEVAQKTTHLPELVEEFQMCQHC